MTESKPCWTSRIAAAVVSLTSIAAFADRAAAHPHVWVAFETTVAYANGSVTALKHRWTFDEFYTAMAIQGLDTNKDGTYDTAELAELAKINMEGLKEFNYFTYAKLGATDVKMADPQDAWLEHKDGILTLNFTLPLASPVLAEAEGLTFSVYDPSFFIAFDLGKADPIKLAEGAPTGCRANVGEQQPDPADADRLNQAFSTEMGGAGLGLGTTKTISLSCPKT